MTMNALRRVAWVALLVLVIAGCAKKAPEPPPAPPTQTETPPAPPPPPPPPPPQPETPPAPTVTSDSFSPVFFDFDSYALREDGRAALDTNAKLMRDNPDAQITIEGHCDERGTVEYNLALGNQRAQVTHDYLVSLGVAADRMRTTSYGKERPIDPGHDEGAWARNRRAHFAVSR